MLLHELLVVAFCFDSISLGSLRGGSQDPRSAVV
jgi:hypothetical protein